MTILYNILHMYTCHIRLMYVYSALSFKYELIRTYYPLILHKWYLLPLFKSIIIFKHEGKLCLSLSKIQSLYIILYIYIYTYIHIVLPWCLI